ncbi:hypothetical protein NEISICOT_01483 [Neisseria sicca ATCC 29256]|uniref:Uncharacterized protein n=1 Tax=Neisseria sicca ATCC 29256 TaxID=547045 RepID=C6M4N6_NEISI|nr:hypothetical protein NEISICOT_01483 [Neisseria sicca ATCC 29256]
MVRKCFDRLIRHIQAIFIFEFLVCLYGLYKKWNIFMLNNGIGF